MSSSTTGPRVTRALARLVIAALLATIAVGLGWTPPQPAEAAVTTPFAPRFSANTNGDILIRGNALLNCPLSQSGCAAARAGTATGSALNNNSYTMGFIDVDSDASTRSSSSSTLTIPSTSTVLFAGLYWSGYTAAGSGGAAPPTGTSPNRLRLQAPGQSGYRTVTASQVMNAGSGTQASYQSFADITSVVSGSRSGTYTAADIHAATGADRYGAWSIVLVYSDQSLPARNLVVVDGYGIIQNTAADRAVSIPVSGFTSPSATPFSTQMGAVSYEGDAGLDGDQFSITRSDGTTVPLTNALNPSTNAFNSTQSDAGTAITGRNPQQANLMAYDADIFSGQLLNAGDRSATLNLTTGGDIYFPGVVTFATDLQAPTLAATKTQTTVDVDGDGSIGIGDRIQYAVTIQNTGRDASVQSVFADPLPTGTTLVPGSLTVDGTAITTAADGDRGELVDNAVSVRLGTGPGSTGGRLEVGVSTVVRFAVEIGNTLADGSVIANRAALRYVGAQTGQALSGSSNIVSMPFSAPRSDLVVSKTASAAVLQRNGDLGLSYTIRVRNDGPKPDSGVTITDSLPSGFTATGTTPASCTITGSTVSCPIGALDVGATAVVTVTGTVAADGPATVVNSATATGTSVDPTPGVAGTATTALNTPPTAGDDSAAVDGGNGSSVTIDVLGNDDDADGDPLTVVSAVVSSPAHGTVAIGSDGSLVYTVTDPTFRGIDTVTYQVCDGRGGCTTAQVQVTVRNQPPVVVDDTTGTGSGQPVTIPVLDGARDPNRDDLTVALRGQPTGGTAVVNPDGTITVTPDPGFDGPLTIEYEVCDSVGACTPAQIVVVVDDAAPIAFNDAAETPFETPLELSDDDLLANDTDPNGDTLTVVSVQDAVGGTVTRSPDGVITFTPADGFLGEASFTYTITDGTLTSTAYVRMTVPNTAPTAASDVATLDPDVDDEISIDVLGNDPDAESPRADLAVTLLELPENGRARVEGGQIVFYGADPGFKGIESFDYQVCDPQGLCDVATVTVTVTNQAPVAAGNTRTVRPGQTIEIPVLLNDTDPNGDTLTLTRIVDPPAQGTASVDPATGLLRYTPATNQTDPVTLTYEVCDDDPDDQRCATAVVTINPVNETPVARNDSQSAFHTAGEPTVIRIPVLLNDDDPDGQTLTIAEVAQPVTGTAVIDGDEIVYTAPAGFVGQVVFSYSVTDGTGGNAQALVVATVGNRAPVPVADTGTLDPEATDSFDVLADDTDPDGDALTLRLDGDPTGPGTAAVVDGRIQVTSTGGAGDIVVHYLACDPYGSCSASTLVVSVGNVPPVAVDDQYTTPFGTPLQISDANLLANDTDANDDTLTVVSVQDAVNGTVTRDPGTGAITFTPAPGFVGTGWFTYTVTDGVSTATATAYVAVPSTAPVARDDQAVTPTNTTVSVPVLDNDTDAESPNEDLIVTLVGEPSAGTATVVDQQVVVTPPNGFSGTITVEYQVCDQQRLCDTAIVTVTVDDAAPVAVDDLRTTPYETALSIEDADLLANDTDANGDELTVVGFASGRGGTVTRTGSTITFTPDPGFLGTATFTYTITDGESESTATVYVEVPNTPPVAVDDVAATTSSEPVTVDVLVNDSDEQTPVRELVLTVVDASSGTAEVVDGQVVFTPADGFTGTAYVRYQICDPQGLCDTGAVVITVEADDPPTTEPPTTEPPTSEPPTSEPPTSEPPTTAPPTSESPTSASPTSATPTDASPTSTSAEPPSSGDDDTSAAAAGPGLPGTGADVGTAALVAVLLLAAGALVVVLVRRRVEVLTGRR